MMTLHSWIKRHKFPLLIFFLSFTVALAKLQKFDMSGDAMWTWFVARLNAEGAHPSLWPWDHHTSRLSILLPGIISAKIFGPNLMAYYFPSVLMHAISCTLIFLILFDLTQKKYFSYALTFLYLFSSENIRFFSQLLPSGFSRGYLLFGIFFCLRYIRTNKNFSLILSAFFFFLAYLSKMQNLYYIPGAVLFLLMSRINLKAILLFLGALFIFYLGETVFYTLFTDYKWGRLDIILHGHHMKTQHITLHSLWELGKRFEGLSREYLAYLLTATLFFFYGLKKYRHSKHYLMAFSCLSFYILMTFSIKSFNPIRTLFFFIPRYLYSALPLLFIFIAIQYLSLRKDGFKLPRVTLNGPQGVIFLVLPTIFYAVVYTYRNFLYDDHFLNYPLIWLASFLVATTWRYGKKMSLHKTVLFFSFLSLSTTSLCLITLIRHSQNSAHAFVTAFLCSYLLCRLVIFIGLK